MTVNLLEALFSDLKRTDAPAHAGEGFFIWSYDLAVVESRAILLAMANHTDDRDLLEMLRHFIHEVAEPQIKRVEGLMREEGIILPAGTPDPPQANCHDVPAGARLTDCQIARSLVVRMEGMLDLAYNGMRFSQRSDVAGMFMAFIGQVSAEGYAVRETMLQRGWFALPPMFGEGGRTSR